MTTRRVPVARLVLWAPLVVALGWSLVVLASGVGTQSWQPGYDLAVYRHGAQDLLAGRDVYLRVTDRGHYFVYPPLAALLFVPLLALPVGVDLVVWDVVLVLALVLGGGRLLRVAGVPAARVPTALALVVVSDPFREALVLGQVSPLVVLALVGGAVLAGRSPRWGGALVGAAAAVKVTPALVVLLAVARPLRRWVGWAVVSGGALTLVGALVAPPSWRSYFLGLLWQSSRVAQPGTPSNNSLAGAFAHAGLAASPSLALGSALSVVLLVLVALRVRRSTLAAPDRSTRWRLGLLVSLLTCLASPVTWSHHALAAPLAAAALVCGGPSVRGGFQVRGGLQVRGGRGTALPLLVLLPWLLPVLQWAGGLGGAAGVALALTRPVSLLLLAALLAALLPRTTSDGIDHCA